MTPYRVDQPLFLKSTPPYTGAELVRREPMHSSRRGAPLFALAASLLMVACGPGDESLPGPVVSGAALGAEGAHEHGAARMGLAVDGDQLTLDLQVPGEAVFGFEHSPGTDEERMAVSDALARVRSEAGSVLSLNPEVACTLDGVEILEAPGLDGEHGGVEEDGHHDGEAQDSDEHDHSEMRVQVTWSCATSPEGTPATLQLAHLFPDVEFVDLTVITSRGQAAGRVDGDAAFRF